MAQATDEFHFSPRPNRASEINWRPWSQEAFEQARQTGRPILLSISAVWCHWCHVMDETTYSHAGVIDLINREYVPVRVDNDVRPDINQRYNMGGWPTTAFLTASGDILTGATYLPPDQMATALTQISTYYRGNQAEIASRVLEARKRAASGVARSAGELDAGLVDLILDAVKSAYDPEYGGFGNAPKFPQTDAILLLLEQFVLRSDPDLGRMAVHTLEQMTGGGTYDQVEGGFFRYSTTQDWSVPHYEKMLEDHAGLVQALALAGMADALDRTTGYLDRVLRDPKTGLYGGSQDADEHYYSMDAEERAQSTAPFVDRRIYTSWNAALAVAMSSPFMGKYPAKPGDGAGVHHLLESLFKRAYRRGEGMTHAEGVGGQLGDQVWSLWAAVRAYQHGLGEKWMQVALDLAAHLDDRYADSQLGGYFDHAGGDELGRLGERIKPIAENSVAAMALIELDILAGDPSAPYRERARKALESVAALPQSYGLMAAVFARALDRLRHAIKVSTRNPELAHAAMVAHPYAVVDPTGDERAVVCVGTICLAPVSTPTALAEAIREASRTRA
ncbi:MAG: thioredoxin domain-containing protein [Chloroflexi bacterium]|nr:MAG: thioredoxin domain-containing protein [Chloroflexota bacterium]